MKIKSRLAFKTTILSLIVLLVLICLRNYFPTYLYFNTSSSLPKGIYYKTAKSKIELNDLVLFRLPKNVEQYRNRSWLKHKNLLLKPVKAFFGDTYCIKNKNIFVNNSYLGEVFESDFEGRLLPKIRECKKVTKNNLLVVSNYSKFSFDSRYFGEISLREVREILKPLITF